MSKCHDNRRRTAKRRKKEARRIVRNQVAIQWARLCPKGKNPDYYEPYEVRTAGKGKWLRFLYRVRPNAKYQQLILELAEKCKGVTVDLSAMKGFQGGR